MREENPQAVPVPLPAKIMFVLGVVLAISLTIMVILVNHRIDEIFEDLGTGCLCLPAGHVDSSQAFHIAPMIK